MPDPTPDAALVTREEIDWKEVVRRAVNHIDQLLLYVTFPSDSHPQEAMAFLLQANEALEIKRTPRMANTIKPGGLNLPLPRLAAEAQHRERAEKVIAGFLDEPANMHGLTSLDMPTVRAIVRNLVVSEERAEKAERERDEANVAYEEACNWNALVDRYSTELDSFDDLADKWLSMTLMQRFFQAHCSTFAKWADDQLLTRYRESMAAIVHLAFVEGALVGVRTADARALASEQRNRALVEGQEWHPIETCPKDEEVLFGYYGADAAWSGHFWKGHLFQGRKMERPLAIGSACKQGPTHWRRVMNPSALLPAAEGERGQG